MARNKNCFPARAVILGCMGFLLTVSVLIGIHAVETRYQQRQRRLDNDLIAAVEKQDAAAVTRLLDQGASANARLNGPEPPAWWWRMLRLLPHRRDTYSAPVSTENASVLTLAVRGYEVHAGGGLWVSFAWNKKLDAGIVRSLLAHGADPNVEEWNGKTPLHYALESFSLADVRQMVQQGADVPGSGRHAVPLLASAMQGEDRIAKGLFLLSQGMPLEHIDEAGHLALSVAVTSRADAMLRALLEQGANVNGRDEDGSTALMLAGIFHNKSAMQLLLERGPDLGLRNHLGQTALMVTRSAAVYDADDQREHDEIIHLLEAAGAKE